VHCTLLLFTPPVAPKCMPHARSHQIQSLLLIACVLHTTSSTLACTRNRFPVFVLFIGFRLNTLARTTLSHPAFSSIAVMSSHFIRSHHRPLCPLVAVAARYPLCRDGQGGGGCCRSGGGHRRRQHQVCVCVCVCVRVCASPSSTSGACLSNRVWGEVVLIMGWWCWVSSCAGGSMRVAVYWKGEWGRRGGGRGEGRD
jgi:hypothetical protein